MHTSFNPNGSSRGCPHTSVTLSNWANTKNKKEILPIIVCIVKERIFYNRETSNKCIQHRVNDKNRSEVNEKDDDIRGEQAG